MKVIKTISLTHTPTTHIICIPVEIVRELGLEKENRVLVELDGKKIIVTKLEQN
jgi:bifunctional DNA-binding transcriptional regulator/antitoxin component of YhaV-PrlF toxin-antitoxin module